MYYLFLVNFKSVWDAYKKDRTFSQINDELLFTNTDCFHFPAQFPYPKHKYVHSSDNSSILLIYKRYKYTVYIYIYVYS